MPDTRGTVWDLEPHTERKHEILRRHLGAWLPILGQTNGRIVYIDGFAGPGMYSGGEPGSPVVAIRTALDHKLLPRMRAELIFVFIENREDRAKTLKKVLRERFPKLPPNIKYEVYHSPFSDTITEILDEIEKEGARLAPTFAFIDPFGFAGFPLSVVTRLLSYRACEILVTFMEGFVVRFLDELRADALNELFGTDEWVQARDLPTADERRNFLLALYERQLRRACGAKFVRSFEMVGKGGNVLYYLVFATKHLKGLDVMKNAMWKADPTGQFRFSDRTDPTQTTLLSLENEPSWAVPAAGSVFERFRGHTVPVEDIGSFVIGETPFLFHKRPILGRLESEGKITSVVPRQKARTWPRGCRVTFAS